MKAILSAVAIAIAFSARTTWADPTPTPIPSIFKVGDRVQTTRQVNVRASDSLSGTLLGTQPVGALGTLVSGPTTASNIIWWRINYDTGVDGISGEDNFNLAPAPASASTPTPTPAPAPAPAPTGACNLFATPTNFASQISAAAAGQAVCLATGDYGTWSGTSNAITIKADSGAVPKMQLNLNSAAAGFTLDGMTGMGGTVASGANGFTIRNSVFTDTIDITATNANILLDHNTHDWPAVYRGFYNAKIRVQNDTGAFSGVTVQNSTIRNGDLDGVHLGAGINILNNIFDNLCDKGTNHTDNIQFEGGTGGRIAYNYIHSVSSCETQAVTSFDSGTVGVIIEHNVIDTSRGFGVEFYADKNSIIRHNVMVYHPSGCATGACGYIDINRKSADPAGSGTQVYDNIVTGIGFKNGSTGTSFNNMYHSGASGSDFNGIPVFVGGANPTTFSGYKLAPGSPGVSRATDGTDVGI